MSWQKWIGSCPKVLSDTNLEYYEDFILEEKCKFMQVEKISSKVRMEIYTIFLNFAQQNNLFHNSIGQD